MRAGDSSPVIDAVPTNAPFVVPRDKEFLMVMCDAAQLARLARRRELVSMEALPANKVTMLPRAASRAVHENSIYGTGTSIDWLTRPLPKVPDSQPWTGEAEHIYAELIDATPIDANPENAIPAAAERSMHKNSIYGTGTSIDWSTRPLPKVPDSQPWAGEAEHIHAKLIDAAPIDANPENAIPREER